MRRLSSSEEVQLYGALFTVSHFVIEPLRLRASCKPLTSVDTFCLTDTKYPQTAQPHAALGFSIRCPVISRRPPSDPTMIMDPHSPVLSNTLVLNEKSTALLLPTTSTPSPASTKRRACRFLVAFGVTVLIYSVFRVAAGRDILPFKHRNSQTKLVSALGHNARLA